MMINRISLLSLIAGLSFSLTSCDDENIDSPIVIDPIPETYTFEDNTALGCSDFLTYIAADDQENKVFLKVSLSQAKDLLSAEDSNSLTLELPYEDLTVEIVQWDLDARSQYCADFVLIDASTPTALETYTAVSGTAVLTANISDTEDASFIDTSYKITVDLSGVILEDTDGNQIQLSDLSLEEIVVGSLGG